MQPNQLSFRPGFWSPSGDRARVRCVNKLSPTAAAPREASENFRRQPMQILSEREACAELPLAGNGIRNSNYTRTQRSLGRLDGSDRALRGQG